MQRFAKSKSAAGWMPAVWTASIAIAFVVIWTTLQESPDTITLPTDFDIQVARSDVLVGSSLSWAALPDEDRYRRIVHPGRRTRVASLDGISEAHSLQLVQAAIAAGATTVLLEVNALAHEYNGLRNHPVATTVAGIMAETGKRLTSVARAAVGLPAVEHTRVRIGRHSLNRREFALAGPVEPELFPRAVWDTSALEKTLADARRRDTRILLFWPPLPEGGFGRDRDRYRAMSDHIKRLANRYALPLWVADGPWPDELFMDKFGHLNLQGRQRFAGEIAAWARSL